MVCGRGGTRAEKSLFLSPDRPRFIQDFVYELPRILSYAKFVNKGRVEGGYILPPHQPAGLLNEELASVLAGKNP